MAAKKSSAATVPTTVPSKDLVLLRALEPIRADGVDYAPGDELALDDAAAEGLLASGAAELAS